GGGGGLTLFEESRNTASPNAAVPVHTLTASGAETNIDAVISPKGTGAFSLQVADGTAVGGDKRGVQAIDLQTGRTNATHVASGAQAVTIGYSCLASGSRAVALGGFSSAYGIGTFAAANGTATGSQSISFGVGAYTLGAKSAALSPDSQARLHGAVALCGANWSSSSARSQIVLLRVFALTTDAATQKVAISDQGSPSSSNQLTFENNSSNSVRVRAMAVNTALGGGCKTWEGRVVVQRGANAASTSLVMSSVTSDYSEASMATCDLALSVSEHGGLAATVTGIDGMTIRWSVFFENLEMRP
ncbi:hypothetical protein, partial [Stutzerimonas stutzeri]|uniref:hypothetical protein n=1 Tax=Stutzerimonas stutzeri TaxID=316 RepID=UPI0018659FA8